jgi:cytochrome c biogenesis protein CcdA
MKHRVALLFPALIIAAVLIPAVSTGAAAAAQEDPAVAFYFSGVGCSKCAEVDPVVFGEWLTTFPDIILIEYEIQNHPENAVVHEEFTRMYGIPTGTPLLVVSGEHWFLGKSAILGDGRDMITLLQENPGSLGGAFRLDRTSLTDLEGRPTIWRGDRALTRTGTGGDSDTLRRLLTTHDPTAGLEGAGYAETAPVPPAFAGSSVTFAHAVTLGSWLYQWNGPDVTLPAPGSSLPTPEVSGKAPVTENTPLSAIAALAVVDAINPCALSVLALILTAIVAHDPGNPRSVFRAGMTFVGAVFAVYFLYGAVIVAGFSLLAGTSPIRSVLPAVLGAGAVLLGLVYLRAAAVPGTGGMLAALPGSIRPLVARCAEGAVSVPGACVAGAAVSLFLLPCTMGPYLIAGGLIGTGDVVNAAFALLLYNLIFILPMAAVTFGITLGIARIDAVSGWRDAHARILRGAGGILMVVLGIGLAAGLM